jgi:probable F420-dependent oxidoreductase
MKYTIEMSVRGAAAEPAHVIAVAQAAERAGFAMLGYTDHPAPSAKWLRGGGHATFDPFAGLAFLAASTERIRLMTYLAVLPYRNPLLLARSVATVDRLSGGRFTLVAGTGYLRSEFSALGTSFDERNDRFDETIEVLRTAFTDDEFVFEGSDFRALGVQFEPKPVQLPHPPIWIGGSSRTSRERVARYGTGWAPLRTRAGSAQVVRTAPMETIDDLDRNIEELHDMLRAEGRDPSSVAIHMEGLGFLDRPSDEVLEDSEVLEEHGVTHAVLRPPAGDREIVVDAIDRFGAEVIATTT